jgi:Tol biopolymer transport system component
MMFRQLRHTLILILGLLALALALAACGGGEADPTESATADVAPTDEAAPDPTATEEAAPEPAPTEATAPSSALIVFSSNRGANPDAFNLYTVDPASGEVSQITDSFLFAGIPNISPDGSTVAFFTNDGGAFRVHTVGIDGSNLTPVTDFSSAVPGWFPDGQRLVLNSDSTTEPADVPDVYAMNLDGSDLVQIIDSDPTADFQGRVSPDGSRLLFLSDRDGNVDIYVADIDGSNISQLTDTPTEEYSADWSPDGSQILYASSESGNDDVWVMNADGSNPVQLTDHTGLDGQCAFSPDGSQIVFVSDRGGNTNLWIMNADGSDSVQLTEGSQLDIFPDW